MIRGLYTAVSAMITNQQKQNVVVNNLANMDTNGYKSKQLLTKSFDELKLEGYNNYANGTKQKQIIGDISPGISMDETITNFNQGPIKTTDNKMDVAIQGKGFFLVSDAAGNQFYTRNGNFRTEGAQSPCRTACPYRCSPPAPAGQPEPAAAGLRSVPGY